MQVLFHTLHREYFIDLIITFLYVFSSHLKSSLLFWSIALHLGDLLDSPGLDIL